MGNVSEQEKIKEEIGWLKMLFGLSAGLDITLIVWLFENFGVVPFIQNLIAFSAVILVTCAIIGINYWVFKRLGKLGEL